MNIKTISVEYARTFNLGNFNSVRLGVSLTAELDEGENPEAEIKQLQATSREMVKAEYLLLPKPKEAPKNGVAAPPPAAKAGQPAAANRKVDGAQGVPHQAGFPGAIGAPDGPLF